MALRKCKECGNQVSTKAKACPACGVPIKEPGSPLAVGCATILALVLAFIVVVRLGLLNYGDNPKEQTTANARSAVPQSQFDTRLRRGSVRPDADETARIPLDGDATIDVIVTELPNRSVRIHGKTNLPTGTELMLGVKERAQGGYFGQAKCSVLADGSYQSEPFGPVFGLLDGVYVASVVMPIPHVQPDYVQELIGTNGEELSGPLVQSGSIGVTLQATKEFTIGGPQASKLQKERASARAEQYRQWHNKLVALDKRLRSARSHNWLKDDLNMEDQAKWGKFARQFRQDLESQEDQLMRVQPLRARLLIAVPLGDIGVMFLETAFQNQQDYRIARTIYTKSLWDLKKYIREVEKSPKCDISSR